jgi:hypothetical protein
MITIFIRRTSHTFVNAYVKTKIQRFQPLQASSIRYSYFVFINSNSEIRIRHRQMSFNTLELKVNPTMKVVTFNDAEISL